MVCLWKPSVSIVSVTINHYFPSRIVHKASDTRKTWSGRQSWRQSLPLKTRVRSLNIFFCLLSKVPKLKQEFLQDNFSQSPHRYTSRNKLVVQKSVQEIVWYSSWWPFCSKHALVVLGSILAQRTLIRNSFDLTQQNPRTVVTKIRLVALA